MLFIFLTTMDGKYAFNSHFKLENYIVNDFDRITMSVTASWDTWYLYRLCLVALMSNQNIESTHNKASFNCKNKIGFSFNETWAVAIELLSVLIDWSVVCHFHFKWVCVYNVKLNSFEQWQRYWIYTKVD